MTDSLDSVPCAENDESASLNHGEPCLHFLLLIHAYASQIVLRTIPGFVVPQEVISYDVPLQRVFKSCFFSSSGLICS